MYLSLQKEKMKKSLNGEDLNSYLYTTNPMIPNIRIIANQQHTQTITQTNH